MKLRLSPRWLALALVLPLSACGVGQRQNPVASDGELGTTSAVQVEDEKPTTYTTKGGDTLASIAGRPEIYGDPALWPLIQDANASKLAGKTAKQSIKSGMVLSVPRGVTAEAVARAREQSRQAQAAAKARLKSNRAEADSAVHVSSKPRAAKPKPMEKPKPTAVATAAPTQAPTPAPVAASPTASANDQSAQPVPKAHSGLRPLLLLLLLVLAALAAVLWAFSRRDREGD